MIETHRTSARTEENSNYLGWRGELLAQLALARLRGAKIFQPTHDNGLDYLVATEDGICFFVQVKVFSSIRRNLKDVAILPELSVPIERRLVERARESKTPTVLFVFDADTDHGRFLRLDTFAIQTTNRKIITIRLPLDNTIDEESLNHLVSELRSEPRVRRR